MIYKDLNIGQTNEGLIDYKFFCFNGKVEMVYGVSDRKVGVNAAMGIYTADFRKINAHRADERPQAEALPKPAKYERMIEIAERIGENFPHVRVDLYYADGRIYFGEMTFYDGSGYMAFVPDSFDTDLGDKFDITEFK